MGDQRETADEILRTIRRLVRRISEHSRYLSRNVGLTVPQLVCLKAIGRLEAEQNPDITVALIAKDVQLSPATVSRILDRLARKNLITRERSSEDRRKVNLALTTAGTEWYETLPTPLHERFVERLGELPEDERGRLLDALMRIAELMEATDLDAAPLLTPGAEPEPPVEED